MAKRNRDDRRERRAKEKKQKQENKIASRSAQMLVDNINSEQKAEKKRKRKEPKEVIDPKTGLNLSSPSPESTIQSSKAKKKKKVTTVKGPVNTGSIDIPQKSTTTVDGKIVSEKIGDPTKALAPTPLNVPSTPSSVEASESLRKEQADLGEEIRKEAATNVDQGKATQGQFNQALEDASKAEEQVKKEKDIITTPIAGDGKTLDGAMSGGAPPASFSAVGTKGDVGKEVANQTRKDLQNNPNADNLNASASLGAIEKLGVQDYYPTAARNIAVGTFTGEVIGSQTIYSGAGGLAPMGLYDARKRALAKAATAKQAAIDKFLTLDDTAKAYNMEYKDYAYDHLYDILEKHGFSVNAVMRDREAAKEVYRLKDLGKELKFVEEESKTILTTLGEEDKYVPPEMAKLAKEIFYGMQDKDKVFSGKTNLVKSISELKAYNSLTKKAEDLAKEQKLSEQAMTDLEMDNYMATGIIPVPADRAKEFEKERASFVRKVDNGDLAFGSDGYYTGVLKYFGGNVDQLFESYTDAANYSEGQLDAAKKIFVNMVPSSVELSMNRYRNEQMNLLNYGLNKKKLAFDQSMALRQQDGVISMESKSLENASATISGYVAQQVANGQPIERGAANKVIQNALQAFGSGEVKDGTNIPGGVKGVQYSSMPIISKEPIPTSSDRITTTGRISGGASEVLTVGNILDKLGAPNEKTGKFDKTALKSVELYIDGNFRSLSNEEASALSNMRSGKETKVSMIPNASNTSLAYLEDGLMTNITDGNISKYAASNNKRQLRSFSGQIVVGIVGQETKTSLKSSDEDVIGDVNYKLDVKRDVAIPGNWSLPAVKASTQTNLMDNSALQGSRGPEQKTFQSSRNYFSQSNTDNSNQ